MAPFVREFGPGAQGPDVLAVKHALVAAHAGKGITLTPRFGPQAQAALAAFKKSHGLLGDPVYTAQAHVQLERWFTSKDVNLLDNELDVLRRTAFLDTAAWTVAHNHLFDYTMKEPARSSMLRGKPRDLSVRHSADCSMHAIGCGHWAKLPNALFNHDGATGAILKACTKVDLAHARPGDLGVYVTDDEPDGEHVTILNSKIGGDWKVINHGRQGQPIFNTLSAETAGHPGARLIVCQLPTL